MGPSVKDEQKFIKGTDEVPKLAPLSHTLHSPGSPGGSPRHKPSYRPQSAAGFPGQSRQSGTRRCGSCGHPAEEAASLPYRAGGTDGGVGAAEAAAPEVGRLLLLLLPPPRALSRNLPERADLAGAPTRDPSPGRARG